MLPVAIELEQKHELPINQSALLFKKTGKFPAKKNSENTFTVEGLRTLFNFFLHIFKPHHQPHPQKAKVAFGAHVKRQKM